MSFLNVGTKSAWIEGKPKSVPEASIGWMDPSAIITDGADGGVILSNSRLLLI